MTAAVLNVDRPVRGRGIEIGARQRTAIARFRVIVFESEDPLAFRRFRGARGIFCAKYHHHNDKRCIFRCNFSELMKPGAIHNER